MKEWIMTRMRVRAGQDEKREREKVNEGRTMKKKREEKGRREEKKDESETADTGGEGETLPDPQGAEVPA